MSTTPRRRPLRTSLLATSLTAVTVLASGCSILGIGGGNDGPTEEQNQATAEQISDQISDLPGVTDVRATYQDNATAPGTLDLGISMDPGADRETTRDEVYRIVWTSTLDPLDYLAVRIGLGQGNTDVADYSVQMTGSQEEDFAAQFGDRPN